MHGVLTQFWADAATMNLGEALQDHGKFPETQNAPK